MQFICLTSEFKYGVYYFSTSQQVDLVYIKIHFLNAQSGFACKEAVDVVLSARDQVRWQEHNLLFLWNIM